MNYNVLLIIIKNKKGKNIRNIYILRVSNDKYQISFAIGFHYILSYIVIYYESLFLSMYIYVEYFYIFKWLSIKFNVLLYLFLAKLLLLTMLCSHNND